MKLFLACLIPSLVIAAMCFMSMYEPEVEAGRPNIPEAYDEIIKAEFGHRAYRINAREGFAYEYGRLLAIKAFHDQYGEVP